MPSKTSTPVEQDPRWQAVVARDKTADGRFYYSVKTTGVYCRPSCGARRPKPENVQFHETPEQAEQAGFRPCKRCRPDLPQNDRQSTLIANACRLIEASEKPPTLDELATHTGLSAWHLHRLFKAATGLTPRDYAAALQAKRVRGELGNGSTITDAIAEAGYGSSSRFYEKSDTLLGMTPSRFKAGGAGMDILFAVGQCSLGDDLESLIRNLQDSFPKANLIGGDQAYEQLVAEVVGFVEMPQAGLNLPLDIQGTAFQQRVWQALRAIPPGSKLSYAELAQRVGLPKAIRAVASACAANKLAVAIPCHRVVRTDGSLSGYRWGIARKQTLLERESALKK